MLLPQLLRSGSLSRVQQIAIELDTGRNALTAEDKPKVLLRAITNFYELMKVGGYRIVASEPDACIGRIEDQGPGPKRFNTKTQVVLYKM